mgnify:CR=1 FL=1
MKINDAVLAAEEGAGRADVHARRIRALIAEDREEEALGIREAALFHRLDPAPVHAHRNVVFGLARDRARMAPDTRVAVEEKAEAGHRINRVRWPSNVM